jgi:hypothetical protein
MSKWVRGIYNTAANFVMSGSLRAASGSSMGRNPKQLREEHVKSDKCNESCESTESCDGNLTTYNKCGTCNPANWNAANDRPKPHNLHVDGCLCSICRDYDEYTSNTAGIRTEGQGAGARIRVSNEPRTFKQSDQTTTNTVEQSTGIPTGVTI